MFGLADRVRPQGNLRALALKKSAAVLVVGTVAASGALVTGATAANAAPKPRTTYTVTGLPILREGSQSSAVKNIQGKLKVKPRTGYFGPLTRAAVIKFQRSRGIPTTGVVAELTWAALNRIGKAYKPTKAKVKAPAKTKAKKPAAKKAVSTRQARINKVLAFAKKLQGIPYRATGYSPSTGFNCSSYTQYVFQQAIGHNLGGAYTVTQYNVAKKKITRSQARRGDLVFFHDYPNNFLGHVGIYAGNNKYWHAPRTGRVVSLDTFPTNKLKFARVI